MNKKIGTILVCFLLSSVILLVVNNDSDVEAAAGGGTGDGGDNNMELDMNYMYQVTLALAGVIHNDSIWGDGIRKGRDFGSAGDWWTANYLFDEMNVTLYPTLENVEKITIKNITGKEKWEYNYKIDVIDFKLRINGSSYTYPHIMPKNETYPWATGSPNLLPPILQQSYGEMNYKHTFTNLTIVPRDLTKLIDFTMSYINVSCNDITKIPYTMGNATYIPINGSIPSIQECQVFLLEEEEGVENQLDNITASASTIILIHNKSRETEYYADTANYTNLSIGRVDNNDNNLNMVVEMLKNNTFMIAHNFGNGNETFSFTYNFDFTGFPWGDEDFFFVSPHDPNNYCKNLGLKSFWILLRNYREWFGIFGSDVICHGVIAYDNLYNDTHLMWPQNTHWKGWTNSNNTDKQNETYNNSNPWLQMFFVNKSIGYLLENISDEPDTRVSGYFEQANSWVEAYNVIGNITIDHSPNDNITIISNRYDGWWSEAPGDSGAGAGIVLGIAKYFHDNNIKPKYNLTFLLTTGEEWGYRGAWHYSHSHPEGEYNITRFIGTDQLGFNQEGSYFNPVLSGGPKTKKIMDTIAVDTMYEERTNYSFDPENNSDCNGLDAYAFLGRDEDCDIICIHKNADPFWYGHHRAGNNFIEGDSMNYMDRNDLNVTFEYSWSVVKYYCVNPDCWLDNVTYESFDSPNDGDTLTDSIRANFTIKSILPHDKVMINTTLINDSSEQVASYIVENVTVNSSGVKKSIMLSIPDVDYEHDYYLTIKLFNSTARINSIVGEGPTGYNDTSSSNVSHLYQPFGYPEKGDLNHNISNNITGSVFMVHEDGTADNITAYINRNYMSPGPYKCMLYRLNDSKLIGATIEDWSFREDEDPLSSSGWAVFNFSNPKPTLKKDTEYVITCWGENSSSKLYYKSFTGSRGRYNETTYQENPPDPISFTGENKLYSIYCSYTPEKMPPEITNVTASPNPVGYGGSVTITADVTSNKSSVDTVKVNIVRPEDDPGGQGSSYTMSNTEGDTYEYVFNDTWQNGQYNYTIWAEDNNGNSNTSSNYSFNVSAQATVSVCTVQDDYGNNTWVNITDPPTSPPQVGYELLDNGEVLRIWNPLDSYYFDTNSGIQLTNHYDEYWSHNVLMLGYYNNDEWNLIYRTDELSGFNKDITSEEDYVNATLWKDLSYNNYDFRLAIRYHLGVDDNELTIIPYIKNIDNEDIPYNLGFAWEIKDIQIDMTTSGDYIEINGTSSLLNQSLDEAYKNLDDPCFYIKEDFAGDRSESLYLRWDEDLNYKVKVESRDGQYNAPVTLGVKIGTLDVGQEKHTILFWYDLSEVIYYYNSYDNNIAWATSPSNMVDGSISNYASTTQDGDEELCDGNNCSGSDLGDIGIVELRSYGYYSGYPRMIILRPVFGGTTDGFDYIQSTNSTPSWSEWSDITYDLYAPNTWTWSDVQNLDCKVIAEDCGSTPPFTLYCSKVEIRVRYTPNNDPTISNPVPADDSTGVSITPMLNITVSDLDGDNMNITWCSNSSGSWVAFGTNNSVVNGTYHQTMSNASVNGKWWYWKVNVTDGSTYVASSVYKFYTGYESKIKNTGSTNFSGYLLMQVQYYDEELEDWFLAEEPVNETTPRTIVVGSELGLDTIFNGAVETQGLLLSFGNGTYRVYAAFRDPDGDVLVCDDETLMEDSYEFTLTDT